MLVLDYRTHKRKIISLFILAIALTFAVVNSAYAVPTDAPAGSTTDQRVEFRKKEQKVSLDSKEQVRIKSRCAKTQSKIRDIQTATGPVVKSRENVYKKIEGKLLVAIGQLKIGDQDTFKIEQQKAEYTKQVAALENSMSQYKQTLDDIVSMNCQADPVGFVALVKTARQYHDLIRQQSANLKKYVIDTIKPSLAQFVNDLQPKTQPEESS